MRLPIVAAASFVLTVFAGCVGDVSSSEGPASEAPQVNSGAAEFDGETGAVQGTVTDDEIQPIANAQVGILKSDLVPENIAVLTDQSGRFTLSRVPPGTHSIIATALGYETAGSKIEVIAGQVVEKSFIIPKLPTDEALKIVYSVKGSIDRGASWKLTHPCIYEPLTSVNPLLKTCGGIVQGGSNQEIGIGSRKTPTAAGAVEPDWATMMVELVWTQQTAVVGRSLQLDILFPNITRGTNGAANQADPRYFQNPDYTSPIQLRIDRPTMDERKIPFDDHYGNVRSRVFVAAADLGTWQSAPDVGVMLEQSFTFWVSLAYKEPLAPEESALPDA